MSKSDKSELKPMDFRSLRSIAERLGEVVEGLAQEPAESMDAARQLLDDLTVLLPKKSLAELSEGEFTGSIGMLAEIAGHEKLALIIGPGTSSTFVSMLWTGNLVVHNHPRRDVYPRWDLQSPIPDGGIPTRVTRIELERPVLSYGKTATDASTTSAKPEEFAEPEESTVPDDPVAPPAITHPMVKLAPKPTVKPKPAPSPAAVKPKPATEKDELKPISFEVFSKLPNRSMVTAEVKATGGQIDAVRTRKGRWRVSDLADTCSDREAWEEFQGAADGNPVHLVVGSHES